jgi:hypothetical protein
MQNGRITFSISQVHGQTRTTEYIKKMAQRNSDG